MKQVFQVFTSVAILVFGFQPAFAARSDDEKVEQRQQEAEEKKIRESERLEKQDLQALHDMEKRAAREGKIICVATNPKYGCDEYHRVVKDDQATIVLTSEAVFKLGPPVTVIYNISFPENLELEVCQSRHLAKLENPKFFKNGEPLPELERPMFEAVFNIDVRDAKQYNVCITAIGENGSSTAVVVDKEGKPVDYPFHTSWHFPYELPPLIGGAKSILLQQKE